MPPLEGKVSAKGNPAAARCITYWVCVKVRDHPVLMQR